MRVRLNTFMTGGVQVTYRLLLPCALMIASAMAWSAPQQDEVFGDDFEGFMYPACDAGLATNDNDPNHYAAAMDLCAGVTQQSGKPGLIDATLTRADGTGSPSNVSYAIRSQFGSANTPQYGASMVVLSTGHAAAVGQVAPSFSAFDPGVTVGTSSGMPADWLALHGGTPPVAPGCPDISGTTANDAVMLTLTIRVPGAAHSFSTAVNFYAADYPEWVCSPYNDIFVALLDSVYDGTLANPSDKNLAQYFATGSNVYPLGVNLARNTGLFRQCVTGTTGCLSGNFGTNTCTDSASLAGTGMDFSDPGHCDGNSVVGGGTGWLVLRGNVVPGEVIRLRFAIWDVSDGSLDSLVLLDNFHWSTQTVTPGVTLN
ncbi:MAG TPA: choice-of-anchor L domain-containing protein [Rudaea sp.]|nr:choice-of-anchor L domain-containing protein [Rudaea sp.]